MTSDNTATEERKAKVDLLFNQIAFIAEVKDKQPQLRDELIKPMVAELWKITQEQERNHELDYKRVGEIAHGDTTRGDAYEPYIDTSVIDNPT